MRKRIQVSLPDESVLAGQAFYTKRNLLIYDAGVLGLSNYLIWRCPTHRLIEMFNWQISDNHLDVGVGSGFYLDYCQFPSASPRVALMDLNPEALEFAKERTVRYKPETYVRNVLEPIDFDAPKFDSISLNYLLHCLPGDLKSKATVFDNLKRLMNPGAVCFGSTLLGGGVKSTWAARKLMNFYNGKGIFSNDHDELADLEAEFGRRFERVKIRVIGSVAVFVGYQP